MEERNGRGVVGALVMVTDGTSGEAGHPSRKALLDPEAMAMISTMVKDEEKSRETNERGGGVTNRSTLEL